MIDRLIVVTHVRLARLYPAWSTYIVCNISWCRDFDTVDSYIGCPSPSRLLVKVKWLVLLTKTKNIGFNKNDENKNNTVLYLPMSRVLHIREHNDTNKWVAKVIWRIAALLPRMARSIVFARWRRYAPLSYNDFLTPQIRRIINDCIVLYWVK